jgi:hypothetical protein
MNDRNAWDDSYLIKSWDETVKEYEVIISAVIHDILSDLE